MALLEDQRLISVPFGAVPFQDSSPASSVSGGNFVVLSEKQSPYLSSAWGTLTSIKAQMGNS